MSGDTAGSLKEGLQKLYKGKGVKGGVRGALTPELAKKFGIDLERLTPRQVHAAVLEQLKILIEELDDREKKVVARVAYNLDLLPDDWDDETFEKRLSWLNTKESNDVTGIKRTKGNSTARKILKAVIDDWVRILNAEDVESNSSALSNASAVVSEVVADKPEMTAVVEEGVSAVSNAQTMDGELQDEDIQSENHEPGANISPETPEVVSAHVPARPNGSHIDLTGQAPQRRQTEFHQSAVLDLPEPPPIPEELSLPTSLSSPKPPKRKYALSITIALATTTAIIAGLIVSDNTSEPGPENPIGDALNIQLQSVSSADPTAGIAFAADDLADASHYMRRFMFGFTPEKYNEALDAGAYLVGGAKVKLHLSAKHDESVQIYNVRPILEPREPIATGTAIRSAWENASEGYFAERMGFLLDSPAPEPKSLDSNDGRLLGPAFQYHQIAVNQRISRELALTFYAVEAAYHFTIEIQYSVDGKKFSQLVDLRGKPFGVSADICVTYDLTFRVPNTASLKNLRYQVVLVPDHRDGATPGSYTPVDVNRFAEDCFNK